MMEKYWVLWMCLTRGTWSRLLGEERISWRRDTWCLKDKELAMYLAAEETACTKALQQEYTHLLIWRKLVCVLGEEESMSIQGENGLRWHWKSKKRTDLVDFVSHKDLWLHPRSKGKLSLQGESGGCPWVWYFSRICLLWRWIEMG